MDTILKKLVSIEHKLADTQRKHQEIRTLVMRFSRKSNEMLAACRDGYFNILKAQEFCAEEVGDLSNCVSNIGWPA